MAGMLFNPKRSSCSIPKTFIIGISLCIKEVTTKYEIVEVCLTLCYLMRTVLFFLNKMKYFITFILGIICGPHTGTGSEIPIINVLGMEQEDRFGFTTTNGYSPGPNDA
jgi:hypothetical protein